MSNTTEQAKHIMTEPLSIAYYPLFLMIIGTFLNSTTFIVLCRSSFKNTKKQPAVHYMRAIAIFDILVLYGWNFQHYLSSVYGFTLETYSIPSCKFFVFLGYFTVQTTAWLRVFVCLDRYLSLSRLHKTWFNRSKNVMIIIICIVNLLALFNLHIMIFGCFYEPNGEINVNSRLYTIFPLWDYLNLVVYNGVPFILMVLFNSGVIYHLIRLRCTTTIQNSRIQHRSISITLVIMTFLFLIMTVPASIVFGFFETTASPTLLFAMDDILFTYHVSSFPLYFITFRDFRRECIAMITCAKNNTRVGLINSTLNQTLNAPTMIKLKTTAQIIQHVNIKRTT